MTVPVFKLNAVLPGLAKVGFWFLKVLKPKI